MIRLVKGAISLLLALGAVTIVAEQVVDIQNKLYFMCKHNKEVRTIRVQVDQAGVCSTYYSKQGNEKVVGSGKNQESCANWLNNIKTNLEKSNWTCRDISSARVTADVESAEP